MLALLQYFRLVLTISGNLLIKGDGKFNPSFFKKKQQKPKNPTLFFLKKTTKNNNHTHPKVLLLLDVDFLGGEYTINTV